MSIGTLLSWVAVGMVFTMTDPYEIQSVVLTILYTALFLALAGTFSLAGFAMRVWLLRSHYYISKHVLVAFRQGVLLALLLVVALVLQSRAMLTWWNGLLMVAAITCLEFFFITARAKQ